MELNHLLNLISELPSGIELLYVRGQETCRFMNVDVDGIRVNAETPSKETKSWAPSYLEELAQKIKANVPFNLSSLLNNKGSYRPVLETIIAHSREFYTVRKGAATALVWIPSKPKQFLELEEIQEVDIPLPLNDETNPPIVDKEELEKEMRKGFKEYFSNYLHLSTGKFEERTIDKYFNLYTRFVENPIREKFPQFSSIFTFQNENELSNFILEVSRTLPDLKILLEEKYPIASAEQTLYYEPWTMIRHYKVFLSLLKNLNQLTHSINPVKVVLPKKDLRNVDNHTHGYLRAMRTKPFLLLAGISGTGKSRIVKQLAFESCPDFRELRSDPTSPGNYCLIEVKPNWHDSAELLGYESRIGGAHYRLTPFVKFLVKAMKYPEVPFFVCLDEMNLAPVEQYFAEFLSVLESRTKIDGHIVSESLVKAEIFSNKDYDLKLQDELFGFELKEEVIDDGQQRVVSGQLSEEDQEVFDSLKKNGLRIPENVVVIGTVNMDETTHQSSRKVIDRAMTIEMNLPDGDPFTAFFDNASKLEYLPEPTSPLLYLANETRASDVIENLMKEDEEKTDTLKGDVAKVLNGINSALEGTPFKIAYRVQNELMLYFYQLWLEDKETDWNALLNLTVDQILMMKVLPRVEGDEELLEKPLERLIDFAVPYPAASKKLAEMKKRLDASRFTSFWP